MITQRVDLGENRTLELQISVEGGCITVGQQIIVGDVRAAEKTCTVTCYPGGKSLTWTCPDNKMCAGDCSDPKNPKGKCE